MSDELDDKREWVPAMLVMFLLFIVTIATFLWFSSTECIKALDTREFHYGQRVIVTEGFNVGRKGYVNQEGISYSDCHRTYEIVFDNGPDAVICNKRLIEDKE